MSISRHEPFAFRRCFRCKMAFCAWMRRVPPLYGKRRDFERYCLLLPGISTIAGNARSCPRPCGGIGHLRYADRAAGCAILGETCGRVGRRGGERGQQRQSPASCDPTHGHFDRWSASRGGVAACYRPQLRLHLAVSAWRARHHVEPGAKRTRAQLRSVPPSSGEEPGRLQSAAAMEPLTVISRAREMPAPTLITSVPEAGCPGRGNYLTNAPADAVVVEAMIAIGRCGAGTSPGDQVRAIIAQTCAKPSARVLDGAARRDGDLTMPTSDDGECAAFGSFDNSGRLHVDRAHHRGPKGGRRVRGSSSRRRCAAAGRPRKNERWCWAAYRMGPWSVHG